MGYSHSLHCLADMCPLHTTCRRSALLPTGSVQVGIADSQLDRWSSGRFQVNRQCTSPRQSLAGGSQQCRLHTSRQSHGAFQKGMHRRSAAQQRAGRSQGGKHCTRFAPAGLERCQAHMQGTRTARLVIDKCLSRNSDKAGLHTQWRNSSSWLPYQ